MSYPYYSNENFMRDEQSSDWQLAFDLGRENEGIFMIDSEGCFENGNDAFSRILGWPEEELLGEFFLKVIPKDKHDFMLQKWDEIRRGISGPYEVDIVTQEGKRRSIAVNAKDAQIAGYRRYLVVIHEIAVNERIRNAVDEVRGELEERIAERESRIALMEKRVLRESEDAKSLQDHLIKLSFAFECSPVAIIIADSDGDIEYVNSRFCEMTGFARNDARGHHLEMLCVSEECALQDANVWNRIRSGNAWRGELRTRRKDGTYIWNYLVLSAIRTEEGEVSAYVAMLEDISEVKNAREEGEALRDRIERIERLATIGQTVSNAAHCMKNQMTVMNGGVHVLRHSIIQKSIDQAEQACALLERSSSRLSLILQDMLDYSKPRTPEMMEIDLIALLDRVMTSIRVPAKDTGVDIYLKTQKGMTTLRTDPVLLERILLNLAVNAFDAMPRGGKFEINAFFCRDYDHQLPEGSQLFSPMGDSIHEGEELIIQVSDGGMGIEPDSLHQIFDPFFSSKGSRGTGLGLAAVEQNIIDLGGTVFVDSAPGAGTRFTLCFPVRRKTKT